MRNRNIRSWSRNYLSCSRYFGASCVDALQIPLKRWKTFPPTTEHTAKCRPPSTASFLWELLFAEEIYLDSSPRNLLREVGEDFKYSARSAQLGLFWRVTSAPARPTRMASCENIVAASLLLLPNPASCPFTRDVDPKSTAQDTSCTLVPGEPNLQQLCQEESVKANAIMKM